jgi:hypothetical protein
MKNTIHHRINKLCINAAARDISPGDKKRGPYQKPGKGKLGTVLCIRIGLLESWAKIGIRVVPLP